MIKRRYRYHHDSAQLDIEGLPDKSLGHSSDSIGILCAWQLQLVGLPTLEGKRDHLEALISIISIYVRYSISGVGKSFKNSNSTVSISPDLDNHLLTLISSIEGVEPLVIKLDDAQLADLMRCLDDLRFDKRVRIIWDVPEYKPLNLRDIKDKLPFLQRYFPTISGISFVIILSILYLGLPIPEKKEYILRNDSSNLILKQ